jgi:hypothetical protein
MTGLGQKRPSTQVETFKAKHATMKMKANYWTAEHFSQANPAGPGQDDIPSLLRRVAESVEAIGPVEVQDLILHTEVTENGLWYSVTVYFHRLPDTRAKNRTQRKASLSRPTSRSSRTRSKRRAS